jgi:serine/threonine protein kinase
VIHGDIKPQNVLVFKNTQGVYSAKLTDLGYSSQFDRTEDLVHLPESWPWSAPEYHHRAMPASEAIKMEVYTFGMLCLWLLFQEKFSDTGALQEFIKNGKTYISFTRDSSQMHHLNALPDLKAQDELCSIANWLVTATGLCNDQKEDLKRLFKTSIVRNPIDRDTNFRQLAKLLHADRYHHLAHYFAYRR